ncbi:venom protease-like [Ixodes scapularis]
MGFEARLQYLVGTGYRLGARRGKMSLTVVKRVKNTLNSAHAVGTSVRACQTASGKPGRCVSSSDCPRGPHTPCRTQGFVGDSVCCPTESRHKRAASDFPHDPVLAVLRENRQLCGRSPPTKRDSGSPDFPAEYVLGGKGVNDQKRYPFVGFVGDSVCCPTESRHKRAASDFPHDPVLAVLRENRQLCGRSPPTKRDSGSPDFPAEYVLGGKGVNDQKRYPFVVAIFRDEVSVENFWCGGALITRRLVLSAAHCFHKMKNTQFLVRIGSLDISPGRGKPSSGIPMERKVETVLMHPSYNGRQQNADLALLVLDSEAQLKASLRPAACLPLEGAEPDTDTGVILGWGHNAFASDGADDEADDVADDAADDGAHPGYLGSAEGIY